MSKSWKRLSAWLAAHAPRTFSSLRPPEDRAELGKKLSHLIAPVPDAVLDLYGLAGGQAADSDARGVFEGYWFMRTDGVDGLLVAWEQWAEARRNGAVWATETRFPFATDFGGNYLFLDCAPGAGAQGARVAEVEDGDVRLLAQGLEQFILRTAKRLASGQVTIDERVERRESHELYFDATRDRKVGDIASHSLLERLGIQATIASLDRLFGHFEKRPASLFGLAARLAFKDETGDGRIEIDSTQLVDPFDNPLPGRAGSYSGGGGPGNVVYVWSEQPLPAGARLKLLFASIDKA